MSRRPLPPPSLVKPSGRQTRPIADHRVFRISEVTYTPTLPHEVYVLECTDWCNVLAETVDGAIVFVWQYRFGSDAMSLEIPGGVVDPGEEPLAAARRELREETGYEADRFELVSVVEPNPAIQGNRCWTYFARGARRTGETAFDEMEDLETVLVPKDDIAARIDAGEVTHALAVVALEAYLRRYAHAPTRVE